MNPFDAIPPQAWLLLALAVLAWAPISYLWRHFTAESAPRDITQPPPDLSWKSRPALLRNLAMGLGLFALAIFIFTPQAEAFAQSEWLAPTLMGLLSSFALGSVGKGWRSGEIAPLVKGVYESFERATQPKRFWASMGWNGLIGIAMAIGAAGVVHDALTPQCRDAETTAPERLEAAVADCNALLAERTIDNDQRAEAHATRGRIFHRIKQYSAARRDYTAALAREPDDPVTLNNRGLILLHANQPEAAIKDFDASLALRADADVFRVRAIAHAVLGNVDLALRDIARMSGDRAVQVGLLVALADEVSAQRDYPRAIALASRALALDPRNTEALKLRAGAYWALGDEASSKADDDAFLKLKGMAPQ